MAKWLKKHFGIRHQWKREPDDVNFKKVIDIVRQRLTWRIKYVVLNDTKHKKVQLLTRLFSNALAININDNNSIKNNEVLRLTKEKLINKKLLLK